MTADTTTAAVAERVREWRTNRNADLLRDISDACDLIEALAAERDEAIESRAFARRMAIERGRDRDAWRERAERAERTAVVPPLAACYRRRPYYKRAERMGGYVMAADRTAADLAAALALIDRVAVPGVAWCTEAEFAAVFAVARAAVVRANTDRAARRWQRAQAGEASA